MGGGGIGNGIVVEAERLYGVVGVLEERGLGCCVDKLVGDMVLCWCVGVLEERAREGMGEDVRDDDS